jgi:large subunit ribosomal protein L13
VISGYPKSIIERYTARRAVRNKANPEHSPHWPRRPDMLVNRIVRGMLPYDRPRGKAASKRLRVYLGVPDELKEKAQKAEKAKNEIKTHRKFIVIKDLCRELGWYGQA